MIERDLDVSVSTTVSGLGTDCSKMVKRHVHASGSNGLRVGPGQAGVFFFFLPSLCTFNSFDGDPLRYSPGPKHSTACQWSLTARILIPVLCPPSRRIIVLSI